MSDLGNNEIMAQNIQFYLDMNNKTRQDLCDALGFKYPTVADWLQGRKYPRIDKIEMMANYFHISKADLVERKDRRETAPPTTGRDILKALCKDSPQALALIDKMQVTDTGDVTISGVDFTSAEIIGHALRGVLVALTRAKKTEDGSMEVVISLDAIFPPRDGGSR